MKVRYNLNVNFDVEARKTDDHWTLTAKPFGWTLYAKTEDDAFARLNDAFRLFVDGYIRSPGGADKLKEYLDTRKIRNTLIVERITRVPPGAATFGLQEMGSMTSSSPGTFSISRTGELLNAIG